MAEKLWVLCNLFMVFNNLCLAYYCKDYEKNMISEYKTQNWDIETLQNLCLKTQVFLKVLLNTQFLILWTLY